MYNLLFLNFWLGIQYTFVGQYKYNLESIYSYIVSFSYGDLITKQALINRRLQTFVISDAICINSFCSRVQLKM